MLRIIGVAHRAQSHRPGPDATPAQQAFTGCLNRSIHAVPPAFIAEENSEEALAERQETSIAERIADEEEIEHRFCDPNREQRAALHYRDGQTIEIQMLMDNDGGLSDEEIHLEARAIELGHYFPIRERFWLDRLDGCREHDVIFICGNAHIEGFTALLDREGIRYEIVERGIGVTQAEHDDFRRIVEYLEAHPELRNG